MKQNTLSDVSSLAVHDDKNITVHGTCVGDKSEIQFVRVLNSNNDDGVDYKVLRRCRVPGDVYDMHWIGDKLVFIKLKIFFFYSYFFSSLLHLEGKSNSSARKLKNYRTQTQHVWKM